MTTGSDRILYCGTKNASSWALRAWLAMKEAGIPFEERVVDIRPPQRYDNLAKIATFSPPGAVPVLVDGGTVIYDSLAIMEYANELSGGRLLPRDVRRRAHTRSLLAWQHSGLSGLCPDLSYESAFYAEHRAMTDVERAEARRIFDVWESELKESGGPYLAGELSLADLAFVPTVLRLTAHAGSLSPWPLSQAWIERLLTRPAAQQWLDEARGLPVVGEDEYWR